MTTPNVRTVSDTKRAFYSVHTRPINSIYRRVVEELMVEMHLLSVNAHFAYSPIYALGVVTAYDRFMAGYSPERDLESIFRALCTSVGSTPEHYRGDADRLRGAAASLSADQLCASLKGTGDGGSEAEAILREVSAPVRDNPTFKYSRLFAIGLYTLLEAAAPEVASEEARQKEILAQVGEALHLPTEKLEKDLELYRSNLEKLSQAREALADTLEAERKRRAQREAEREAATATATAGAGATEEAPGA
ncbi:MAG: photosystem II biogenesis protein Psp29 [Cyanophyceae cyanobacterium]